MLTDCQAEYKCLWPSAFAAAFLIAGVARPAVVPSERRCRGQADEARVESPGFACLAVPHGYHQRRSLPKPQIMQPGRQHALVTAAIFGRWGDALRSAHRRWRCQ